MEGLGLTVNLDCFQGPFDLLYHLIEKNEVDIHDIPIAEITDQYMDFINRAGCNMELTSEFLVMAATLLEIKSKMLLPRPKDESGDELDPREALAERLLEYQRFKKIADMLRTQAGIGETYIFKSPETETLAALRPEENTAVSELLAHITPERLSAIFDEVMCRRELKTDKVRAGFSGVKRDFYTVETKCAYIESLLFTQQKINFTQLFMSCETREEMVVTFLALLELVRYEKVTITQERIFEDIVVEAVK